MGALGERIATEHLIGLGLRIVERNWRCRYGELDIVAAEDSSATAVFVEVKTRTTTVCGHPAEAVTAQKLGRLRRLAGLWLAGQETRWAHVRIDVIGVQFTGGRTPELNHLRGVC